MNPRFVALPKHTLPTREARPNPQAAARRHPSTEYEDSAAAGVVGILAADGMEALNPVLVRWWLIAWPLAGLSLALLAQNIVGDGLREAVDPKG
jgi:hypothetical protein